MNEPAHGFSWGYGGSGTAQLALALLADVVDADRAVALHQGSKRQRIAPLPQSIDWSMTASDVLAWVENAEGGTAQRLSKTAPGVDTRSE
jgi:Family of unknown function (DUF6166)